MKQLRLGQTQYQCPRSFPKTLRVMKLTTLLLFLSCLQVSATAYSQDNHISLSLKRVTLEKVISAVQKQTDYLFLYNNEKLMLSTEGISIRVKDATIQQVMKAALKGQPFTYKIIDKTIIIIPKEDQSAVKPQPVEINGRVTDSTGAPLIGVSVKVKPASPTGGGANTGTITDAEGRFSLELSDENATLIFSYIGYQPKEVALNEESNITIVLKASASQLNQLVVVGYGTQKKEDVTGAIGSYEPSVKTARPVLSPDLMIQGHIPGVMVTTSSGTPGSSVNVRIRGIGSLSASNQPLYVIDGVPIFNHNASIYDLGENVNPLAALNPNDIASVEVLKDAAAAAIYGSRATNGVVLITTKSGKKGEGKLRLNAYTGFQEIPRMDQLKMAGADEYVSVINEAINNYNVQNSYHPGGDNYIKHIYNPYPGMGSTDWFDLITRTAKINNVSLSFSNGSDQGSFYISGSYMDQDGVILTNNYRKYTAKINLDRHLNDWLTVGANTFFSYSRNNRVPGSNRGSAIWLRALGQRPFDRPYKPDGSYYVGGTEDLIYHNPLQVLNERNSYLDNYRLIGNAFAEIKFLKDFTFKSSFGTDLIYTHDYQHYTKTHPYGAGTGRVVDGRRFSTNLLWENTLTYKKQLDQLSLTLLAGHSFQKEGNSNNGVEGRGFPSPSFDVVSVAATIFDGTSGLSANALESYFGRANLSWADKYLLALSMRADGSSKFSPDHRWGYFPSVSAGWIMSKEDFWKWNAVSLKWRASYGATGNQSGISQYAYQALMGGGYNYNENSGIAITTFGNDQLTWESANQFNIGFNLGLYNDKVSFEGDYFIKNTTNLLYSKPIYATSGFTSIISNIGSMRNTGFEFAVNTNFTFGDFSWNSRFNISFIQNELTSLLGDDNLLIGGNRVLRIGKPVGSFYVYRQLGLYQDDKEIPETFYDLGVRAGDVKYEDVNNDGLINVDDRQIVGNSNPDFFGGWNNAFAWKGFDLNIFLTYMQGNDVYAEWRQIVSRLGNGFQGMLQSVVDSRWTGPGTSNTTPRAIYGQSWNGYNSTRWLEDGSFIRLRSLSLGYTFPQKMLAKLNIDQLRIYVQGDNLFLLTNYSGIDPEVSENLDPRYFGVDNFILPQLRTLNIGLNITF